MFFMDSIKEVDNFNFSKYVPEGAKKIEVIFRESKSGPSKYILEIDYITKLESKKIEE